MDKVVINQLPVEKLTGKRVFVRIDANGEGSDFSHLDQNKLNLCLPTLEYLSGIGARVIIGTHVGNPKGREIEMLRLDPLANRLAQALGKPVHKLNESIGRNVLRATVGLESG